MDGFNFGEVVGSGLGGHQNQLHKGKQMSSLVLQKCLIEAFSQAWLPPRVCLAHILDPLS